MTSLPTWRRRSEFFVRKPLPPPPSHVRGMPCRQWLAELPDLVLAICACWRLTVAGPPQHGGMGIVIPVRQDGTRCMLKISWLDAATTDEAAALAAWQGRGAVQVLAVAPEDGAMLLERLDGQRTLSGVELTQALAIAGQLLRRLAIPAPPGFRQLPAVAEELQHTLPVLWVRSQRPMPRRPLEYACDLARQLGPLPGACWSTMICITTTCWQASVSRGWRWIRRWWPATSNMAWRSCCGVAWKRCHRFSSPGFSTGSCICGPTARESLGRRIVGHTEAIVVASPRRPGWRPRSPGAGRRCAPGA